MHDTLPRLRQIPFPALTRGRLETLQVNLGYRCNQQCQHCHVNAGPHRRETMGRETIDAVLAFLGARGVGTLDITGGAPELSPHFRELVAEARALRVHVMDRCNLTVLLEPGQGDTAAFLADHGVAIIASLPCYLEENVDAQRGRGVFEGSLEALRRLNGLGYGAPDSGLVLDLVYNPQGPSLPPPQCALEADYRRELLDRYGIRFNHLRTLTNMPIARFGSLLVSTGELDTYLDRLRTAHQDANLGAVMCRSLVSVDWQGFVYDCDFNQMLGLGLQGEAGTQVHLRDLMDLELEGRPVTVAGHCYGCTAGQGSSCGGALA